MTDESGKRIKITEAELTRLMRQVSEDSVRFTRPDATKIARYLQNECSESEKTTIEEAMLNSASFRREILQLAKDIDSLAIERAGSAELSQITAPDRQTFLEQYVAKPTKPDFWGNLVGQLKRLLIPQVYVPAVATTAAVLVVFYLATIQTPERYVAENIEWRLEEAGLDRNLLRSKQIRGPSRPLISDAKADARTAALSEIRELLTYTDGVFEFNPLGEIQQPPDSFKGLVLEISDTAGQYSESYSLFVPSFHDSVDQSVVAWLVTLPSKSLYRIDLQSDTLLLTWPSGTDDHGCLVLTYRDSDGFRALRGHTVDLRD